VAEIRERLRKEPGDREAREPAGPGALGHMDEAATVPRHSHLASRRSARPAAVGPRGEGARPGRSGGGVVPPRRRRRPGQPGRTLLLRRGPLQSRPQRFGARDPSSRGRAESRLRRCSLPARVRAGRPGPARGGASCDQARDRPQSDPRQGHANLALEPH
jgi:hypothetical protein